ncbi:EamA family transporter [Herbaspirillum rhizosphaerae]|uniref:EamA family transporter n=1 Tax=Herbaspirillum rhizosphaerae TaxID=346179 RepID=A0ABW8Z7T9_9BURK
MNGGYVVALIVAIAAAFGQIVLKMAVERHKNNVAEKILSGILFEPRLWLGIAIYAICSAAWLWVLSKCDVSSVYPLLSLSFALVPIFAYFFLREPISMAQWFSIGLIMFGVIALRLFS